MAYPPDMRLMGYNIYEGGLGRIDPLAEVIRQHQPDLVILPEAADRREFEKLGHRLHMEAFLAQHPVVGARDEMRGAVGILSKFPITQVCNLGVLDPRLTRAALCATVQLPQGQRFTVIGLHFSAGELQANEATRLQELVAILEVAGKLSAQHEPFALVGDFNSHHPEQQIDLSRIREKTRARIATQGFQIPRQVIAKLLAAGYLDAHAQLHAAASFQTSLSTRHPALRVDYVFIPAYLGATLKRCDYPQFGIAKFASDHFPVVADLELEHIPAS